ncbi:MAG: AAA family ATPase [Patescibacteria group bacterium]
MLIGHDNLIKLFKKLADGDKLSHAYLFFGESQVGKFLFALSLANYLERKKFLVEKNILLEETLIIAPDENGTIGIDAAKSTINFLAKKPVFSKKRIIIIRDAENMTAHAQNAILKLVEEPPEEALIILIAVNNDLLLPALISRLQKIYFQRVGKKEIEKNEEFSKLAKKFLTGSFDKNFLETIVENDEKLDKFFEFLIIELKKDIIKNLPILKETLRRLTLLKTLNVNKKLQLKAISSKI